MIALDTSTVRIGARASDKIDAIRQVGQVLVDAGNIEPGYIESMLAREKVANTFLGNGIAIPHGVPKDRGLIRKTGVAVLQVPDGVEWNPGERVHLVVGIAAKSDEHLEILTNLTNVLGDVAEAARLAKTTDAGDIAERLSSGRMAKPAPTVAELPEDLPHHFDIVIDSPHGLHARPATTLVDIAKGFESIVRIRREDRVGDAKSLIAILNLGVDSGATIRVMADGPGRRRGTCGPAQRHRGRAGGRGGGRGRGGRSPRGPCDRVAGPNRRRHRRVPGDRRRAYPSASAREDRGRGHGPGPLGGAQEARPRAGGRQARAGSSTTR